MKIKLLLLIILFSGSLSWGQNLKTLDKKIVDSNGNEVILKGAGLGGWMLMEGYMMQSSDVADTQHEFRERLEALIGQQKTDEFFDAWLSNHVTKKDIDSLAKWGFNSVRLPMHYNLFTLPIEQEPVAGENTWLDKGFTMVDDLLDWCEANQMYLILDLHAAPGGQGANAAISDYDPDKPSLWESEENQNKTVALWGKLAERYKDEPYMGGYDLLNEVNWNLPGGTQLRALYEAITTEIRKVDTNHIIFIEGNWFANDFTGLTPAWDDNMVYSFHKYWSFNDQASIQWVLDLRESENVPLWMGEAGENSNTWFQEAISLFEKNGIGWSWWPMKRIETTVSPYSIPFTQGYKEILEYWRGNSPKPSEAEAFSSMMELAQKTNSSSCEYHKDVQDAQFRQIVTDETKPFSKQTLPGTIHMSEYDLGKNNFAYYDIDAANYQLSTNNFQAWNSGWTYRNDGVDIERNVDAINSNGYHVGFTNKGEWINYTVEIEETGLYKMEARIAGQNDGGEFHLSLNKEAITTIQTTSSTGGWTNFETQTVTDIALEKGVHTITFHIDGANSFNISSMTFSKTGSLDDLDALVLNGELGRNESSVEITANQDLDETTINGSTDDFKLMVNNQEVQLISVALAEGKKRTLVLEIDGKLLSADVVKLSYTGTAVKTTSGKSLGTFQDFVLTNNLQERFVIPGKIEAENYSGMSGLQTEDTSDDGGGQNIGYTDPGDYADYLIHVTETAKFTFIARAASQSSAGKIGIFLVNADESETELLTLDLPVTGGWQNWQNVFGTLDLSKGHYTLRMKVLTGGFNLNYMEIKALDTDQDGVSDLEDECPNSNPGVEVNEKGCEVFKIGYDNFTIKVESETCRGNNNGRISVVAEKSFQYTATISGGSDASNSFTTETEFTSLEAGSYEICFTASEDEDFIQCFEVEVTQPEDLSVISSLNQETSILTLKLSGSKNYFIALNGKEYVTTEDSFQLVLQDSENHLVVKTDQGCQGEYKELIRFNSAPYLYPNPVTDSFYVSAGNLSSSNMEILIFDITGKLVEKTTRRNQKGSVQVDASRLSNGVFFVKIVHENQIYNYKILK